MKTDEGALIFKHLSVEEGHKIKRYHAGGRGTARAFYRRYSHIHIILEAKKVEKVIEPAKKQPETKKVEKKPMKKLPVTTAKTKF